MKYFLFLIVCLMFIACQGNTQDKVQLKTQKDSVSYMLGMSIGKNFKQQMIEVDAKLVARAIDDQLSGMTTMLTDVQAQTLMMTFQSGLKAKQEAKQKELSEKNIKEGTEFLAANKKKDSVVTTASGLQYKILKKGYGTTPKETDRVGVHYRGTLLDGTEIDNSYKRGEPAAFSLNQLIKGWSEALQLMTVGSKWMLYIPSDIAWGEQGSGPVIPPNATIVFEVELIDIK